MSSQPSSVSSWLSLLLAVLLTSPGGLLDSRSSLVVSYALYCVDVERASQFSSLEITYFMLASGCLTFGLFALSQGFLAGDLKELLLIPVTNPKFTITILYQGLGCSVLGYLLSNFAIANIGLTEQHPLLGFRQLSPILAAVVVLGEPFSYLQIFAGILVVLASMWPIKPKTLGN